MNHFLFDKWTWKMAWRDGRAHRTRFLLFISCIALGVMALVAIRTFGSAIRETLNGQSKSLLGGDLVVYSNEPHPEKLINFLKENAAKNVREWRFASMGKFPDSADQSRLIQVRAIEEGFPLFGEVETEPANALEKLYDGSNGVLVDEPLMLQFNAKLGDRLVIGLKEFKIVGYLKSLPGESFMVMEMAPRVLMPFKTIEETGLVKFGSRIRYRHYFNYKEGVQENNIVEVLKNSEKENRLSYETINDRQESIDKTMDNLSHFLNLGAFIALVLGGIGIGSAIRVHITGKLKNVAILRCLGASQEKASGIYFVQALFMGFAGGVLGAILGSVLAHFFPVILKSFFRIQVEVMWSWSANFWGIVLGVVITLLFSLTPLLKLREMTAADSLRNSLDVSHVKTKYVWLVWIGLVVLVLLFSVLNAAKVSVGFIMGLSLILSIGLLVFVSWLMMYFLRKFLPEKLAFEWRQGLKNLYRPQNQTLTTVVSLGIGTFMIGILYLAQENMLAQVKSAEDGNSPNLVLFDIQTDQIEKVKEVLQANNLPVIDTVPIVSMKLVNINGESVQSLREMNEILPQKDRLPIWTLNREYRSTYRDQLSSGESIIEGEFIPEINGEEVFDLKKIVPISMEEGIMDDMYLKVGDDLVFDVGGVEIFCRITSKRKVEWLKMRPNFFVLFPKGLLEEAPQMCVMVTKTQNVAETAEIQKVITTKFANVSVLDLSQVVKTVKGMLDKVGLAVNLMAGFSILTGLFILVSSLHLSQLQRTKDNTLLKILGSSRKQVRKILFAEFLFLALLGANVGTILAYSGNFLISHFVFEKMMPLNWSFLLFSNVILAMLTLLVGFIISQKTYRKTSLEVLREEE